MGRAVPGEPPAPAVAPVPAFLPPPLPSPPPLALFPARLRKFIPLQTASPFAPLGDAASCRVVGDAASCRVEKSADGLQAFVAIGKASPVRGVFPPAAQACRRANFMRHFAAQAAPCPAARESRCRKCNQRRRPSARIPACRRAASIRSRRASATPAFSPSPPDFMFSCEITEIEFPIVLFPPLFRPLSRFPALPFPDISFSCEITEFALPPIEIPPHPPLPPYSCFPARLRNFPLLFTLSPSPKPEYRAGLRKFIPLQTASPFAPLGDAASCRVVGDAASCRVLGDAASCRVEKSATDFRRLWRLARRPRSGACSLPRRKRAEGRISCVTSRHKPRHAPRRGRADAGNATRDAVLPPESPLAGGPQASAPVALPPPLPSPPPLPISCFPARLRKLNFQSCSFHPFSALSPASRPSLFPTSHFLARLRNLHLQPLKSRPLRLFPRSPGFRARLRKSLRASAAESCRSCPKILVPHPLFHGSSSNSPIHRRRAVRSTSRDSSSHSSLKTSITRCRVLASPLRPACTAKLKACSRLAG